MRKVLFSSKSGVWQTPRDLWVQLDREFHFTIDVCANPLNSMLPKFWDDDAGLLTDWSGHVAYMNPPYGREIGKWITKADQEVEVSKQEGEKRTIVVGLLPARTDTKWFWENILGPCYEIRLIRGRLKFSGHKNSAPFPSMVVIFR